MTDPSARKPGFGRFGVWTALTGPRTEWITPQQAVGIERLGYGALWVGASPCADLSYVDSILAQTDKLTVATGIVNIWSLATKAIADTYHRLEKAYPGRFLLGIGAGHPEHTQTYRKPYDALVEYLDGLDHYGVPTNRRVIAALGDGVLNLAARRSAGAHPYLVTPEHTAHARTVMGDSAFLAPEHKVVLSTDATEAREIGRETVQETYLGLRNYVNNLKRLGFTDADVTGPGSDRLIDAVIAHGTTDQIAHRLNEHIGAGADHVAIQVLGRADGVMPTLTELAGALGQPRLHDRRIST
jgi:probable F420-dependent oxidoreductase